MKSDMHVIRSQNGNLVMRMNTKTGTRRLKTILKRHGATVTAEIQFVYEFLAAYNLRTVKPEQVGALTSAPLITNGANVWGFMDYQIRSFLTELAEGKAVEWQNGGAQ